MSQINVDNIKNRLGSGAPSFPNGIDVSSGVTTFTNGLNVGTGASVFSPGTNELALGTNSAERLRITSGGKVFLPGTQTDSDEAGRLDIYHTADDGINNPHIRLWGPANQDARIEFGSPTNTGEGGYIMYNDSDEGLYIGSRMGGYGEVNLCTGMNDGSPTSNIRLRVTSGGNVEIANGNLVFSTSGTGIDFSATADGSGTTTSELLDDYEEGTFTPAFSIGSGFTYSQQLGSYTKIGNRVLFNIFLTWSANSNTGGNTSIVGFPFTVPNALSSYGAATFTNNTLSLPSGAYNIVLQISPTSPVIYLYGAVSSGNKVSFPYQNLGSSGEIIMSGQYLANS